jgi:AcrR family transcriptional regulator
VTDVSDTRTRLLEAAMLAIAENGEGALRVQKIAEAVGVREPSVYHFFKNREALVEAAHIERYRRSYVEMVVPFEAGAALADTSEDFQRMIKKILRLIYVPDREEVRSTRMSVMGAAQTSPAIAEEIKRINFEVCSGIAAVLRSAQEKNWIRQDIDPLATAYWVIGQLIGRVVAEMDQDRVNLDQWNDISEDSILHHLFG